jgi:hypothetical protein
MSAAAPWCAVAKGRAQAHSRRLVWMKRSALPRVRGVSGRVRSWRSASPLQAWRQWWLRYAEPLSVMTRSTRAWLPGSTTEVGPERRAPTVEVGIASSRAIAGSLSRCRRRRSISATRAAGTWWGHRCGAELRSVSAPFRRRDRARASDTPAVPTVPRPRLPTPPSSPVRSPAAPAGATLRRQTGILVHVHRGDLPLSTDSLATDSLTGLSRMNNLHSNHN